MDYAESALCQGFMSTSAVLRFTRGEKRRSNNLKSRWVFTRQVYKPDR